MLALVIGTAGTGKTALARSIVEQIGNYPVGQRTSRWLFRDADDFHSEANKHKMEVEMKPLTDEDREPWIQSLEKEILRVEEAGGTLVLAYSGLRRNHRKRLYKAARGYCVIRLSGDFDTIYQRIEARYERGEHFMPPEQLENQRAVEEPPDETERFLELDATEPIEVLVKKVMEYLEREIP